MVFAPTVASVFDMACAGVATACAVYVALRDGRWRKHGLAAQLAARIDKAQDTADRWHETPQAAALRKDVANQAQQIAAAAVLTAGLATKADVEALRVTVAGQAARLKHTADGIDRIEGMLIKRALDRA